MMLIYASGHYNKQYFALWSLTKLVQNVVFSRLLCAKMDDIKKTFDRYDADQNGYISLEEAHQVRQ